VNVLEEAGSLINGERQEQYGNASESHQRIADLWAGYLGTDVTEFDVVNMMILLKVSRTRNQYHRDSYVDIAGYAGLGERLQLEAAGEGIPVELHVEGFTELKVPRVWKRLESLPIGVVAADNEGDQWQWDGPVLKWLDVNDSCIWRATLAGSMGQDNDQYGPFTEVLEDE
jgi:hypothetical protein